MLMPFEPFTLICVSVCVNVSAFACSLLLGQLSHIYISVSIFDLCPAHLSQFVLFEVPEYHITTMVLQDA